jgi:hypothetical protein
MRSFEVHQQKHDLAKSATHTHHTHRYTITFDRNNFGFICILFQHRHLFSLLSLSISTVHVFTDEQQLAAASRPQGDPCEDDTGS